MVCALLQSEAATRYVSLSGAHVPPFETWDQAATNIQAAIDVAVDGDEVLVTNGVYATGGKVMSGDLTNRIAIDKAITVRSVNGPVFTTIQGASGPAINGPAAVRCAWLSSNAALSGFTLRGGATRQTGAPTEFTGGGVWCESNTAGIENCHIIDNSAAWRGGGAFQGNLSRCKISRNVALGNTSQGGGIYSGIANACEISENTAEYQGGGLASTKATNCSVFLNTAHWGGGGTIVVLYNCTVVDNTAKYEWGGVYQSTAINSIDYRNAPDNSTGFFLYSCTSLPRGGPGNITADPQLLPDRTHLAITSPCRGAGTNIAAITDDIDGDPRANPPSIGCDEGLPLVVPAMSTATWTNNTFSFSFQSQPGVTYQLQQTTNLASPTIWTPAGSLVGDGTFRTLTDTAATNQMRFYRLWLQ
jgi:hypothetical protein